MARTRGPAAVLDPIPGGWRFFPALKLGAFRIGKSLYARGKSRDYQMDLSGDSSRRNPFVQILLFQLQGFLI
jgi:hypothetical protein